MSLSTQEGNFKLREGEFENAKQIFSELLDSDPNNSTLIAGFFISSYWDNRIDKILSKKEGKERGNLLITLFNQFIEEVKKRKLPHNDSYLSATYCILTEASTQFKLSYQREGINGLDKEVLSNLIMCLTGIGDYKNAYETLEYTRKYYDLSLKNIYYLAECLFHLGEIEKSKYYYRVALLSDVDSLNLDMIHSEPILSSLKALEQKFLDLETIKQYLPVYLLENNLLDDSMDSTKEEVQNTLNEIQRLEVNLNSDKEDVKFKIECRILSLCLSILDSFTVRSNPELLKKIKNKISSIDPELLDRRISKY